MAQDFCLSYYKKRTSEQKISRETSKGSFSSGSFEIKREGLRGRGGEEVFQVREGRFSFYALRISTTASLLQTGFKESRTWE